MKPLFSQKTHRNILLFSTGVTLASLPFSTFLISVSIIAIAINWLLEGYWSDKISRIKSKPQVLLFLLIYFSVLLGMIYTDNLSFGLKELKIKLPLFILPLIYASSKPISNKTIFYLMATFSAAVLLASIHGTILFFSNFMHGGGNVRGISPFVSHIRLALMVTIAFAYNAWYWLNGNVFPNKMINYFAFGLLVWFVFFLFLLQSLTGIVILFASVLLIIIFFLLNKRNRILQILTVTLLIIIVTLPILYIYNKANDYYSNREFVCIDSLPSKTVNGNPYYHKENANQYENGYLVWINVSWDELSAEWNRRSTLPFSGEDNLSQPLSGTLIRYLASKGLPKDSLGIWQLDETDIALIEAGNTSVVFKESRFGIYPRLYQLFWEIDQYNITGKVSGSPFVQRMIFLRAAIRIISNNLFVGVGTGDVEDVFFNYYDKHEHSLHQEFWYLSHNQFITHAVQVGVLGLFLFLLGWFAPFILLCKYRYFMPTAILLIITLSMFNEDTFQTHIGVSLASLFYSIFIFSVDESSQCQPQDESRKEN